MKNGLVWFLLLAGVLQIAPVFAAKERLVLMPLRLGDEDKNLQGAMETALVEGLQKKYVVFSGELVAKKARDIFNKESRNTAKKECDETRCMQDIAEAFQAELIATTNVTKRSDGYFLALSIQNIFDNKVVYSKSLPCKNCDAYEVVEKLKELSGASVAVTTTAEPAEPVVTNPNDAETALWNEVQKGNSEDDYQAYIGAYPKGKYLGLAKSRLKKLQDASVAEKAKQDQAAWDAASSSASEAAYQSYLTQFPQGQFVALAQERINKLKKDAEEVVNRGSQIQMVAIPAGHFRMGLLILSDTQPVQINAFKLGQTEVTQAQWQAVMGGNPSYFKNCGGNCPVEQVSWDDVQQFIQKLNQQTGQRYRLPSEAEWEYACLAGGSHDFCGSANEDSVGWYDKSSGRGSKTHPVAQKQANAFGLYDMSGNVWEWVQDCYDPSCGGRVLRGGFWGVNVFALHSSDRYRDGPSNRYFSLGFRLAQD